LRAYNGGWRADGFAVEVSVVSRRSVDYRSIWNSIQLEHFWRRGEAEWRNVS
jgi:hypothetical protein